jgi:hypothetical protein
MSPVPCPLDEWMASQRGFRRRGSPVEFTWRGQLEGVRWMRSPECGLPRGFATGIPRMVSRGGIPWRGFLERVP